MPSRKARGADTIQNERTRTLRRQSTKAERLIWSVLRDRRLAGFKFRRQFPVGGFVADFACVDRRLIVDIDGTGHDLTFEQDERRTAALANLGFHVIRFANNEVATNLEGVRHAILSELRRR
ncbi:MAG: endonuclease domain-containing protein [Dongiaceae bacterium]